MADNNDDSGNHSANVTGVSLDAQSLVQALGAQVEAQIRPLLESRRSEESALRKRPAGVSDKDFRFKGNKLQYEFNTTILGLVRRATRNLSNQDKAEVRKALEILESTKESLANRNKLIRMADRSPHGWSTVEEYMSDDLASDSDDEKRIRSAEERAAKKQKRGVGPNRPFRQGAPRGRYTFYPEAPMDRFSGPYNRYLANPVQIPYVGFNQPPMYEYGAFQQPTSGAMAGQLRGSYKRRYGRGACFECGSFDHWAQMCPTKSSNNSEKST